MNHVTVAKSGQHWWTRIFAEAARQTDSYFHFLSSPSFSSHVSRCRAPCCTTTSPGWLDCPGILWKAHFTYVSHLLRRLRKAHSPFYGSAALVERRLLPAGPAYLAHVKRAVHQLTFEEHDKHADEERKRLEALNGTNGNADDDLGVGDEEEPEDLLSLDPKEWKVRSIVASSKRCDTDLGVETRSLRGPWIVPSTIQGYS